MIASCIHPPIQENPSHAHTHTHTHTYTHGRTHLGILERHAQNDGPPRRGLLGEARVADDGGDEEGLRQEGEGGAVGVQVRHLGCVLVVGDGRLV